MIEQNGEADRGVGASMGVSQGAGAATADGGFYASMRALVTGGAGFIGSHLVDALRERGARVAVLDNLVTGRRENVPAEVEVMEVDLRDAAAVQQVVAEFRPTHIFHQAAQASVKVSVDEPATDAAVNVMGGLHLLDAARRTGVRRVVFASTGGAIYGEVPEGERANEDWPLRPKSPYGASKAAFERYLDVYHQSFGLPYTVLRYSNVYGPRQDPFGEAGVVAIFTGRLLEGEPVKLFARREPGDDGCVRDYVWVGDVVRANLLAVERGLDGCYNVGTGIGSSTRQVLAAIEAALGMEAAVEPAPPRPGDLERSVIDPARLVQAGWSATTALAEGIRRTVAWFQSRGGR